MFLLHLNIKLVWLSWRSSWPLRLIVFIILFTVFIFQLWKLASCRCLSPVTKMRLYKSEPLEGKFGMATDLEFEIDIWWQRNQTPWSGPQMPFSSLLNINAQLCPVGFWIKQISHPPGCTGQSWKFLGLGRAGQPFFPGRGKHPFCVLRYGARCDTGRFC